jgi:biopolymer transport protein ExbD
VAVTAGGPGRVRSDINVTPLVDVVLVLLIIFMVVTPLLQRGKDVELPPARTADRPVSGGDPLVVSVTADRAVWVGERRCEGPGAVRDRLADAVREDAARPLLLKGDARLTVGDVRRVMAAAREAGVRGVRVAVERTEARRP